ncbi:hypothetical protein [Blastopirellula marina]|uniref:hypothetical protein n=1 Tax=Blastopirellula marina TaxID=124 RepID=UPI0013048966|nr:hypothetical protein [Blastopirellula marina]
MNQDETAPVVAAATNNQTDTFPTRYLQVGDLSYTKSQVCISVAAPDLGAVYY